VWCRDAVGFLASLMVITTREQGIVRGYGARAEGRRLEARLSGGLAQLCIRLMPVLVSRG
jgi:hypothetical protein